MARKDRRAALRAQQPRPPAPPQADTEEHWRTKLAIARHMRDLGMLPQGFAMPARRRPEAGGGPRLEMEVVTDAPARRAPPPPPRRDDPEVARQVNALMAARLARELGLTAGQLAAMAARLRA